MQIADTINVTSDRSVSYPIEFNVRASRKLGAEFIARIAGRRLLLCTTPTVESLYGEQFRESLSTHAGSFASVTVDVDEASKTIETLAELCDRIRGAGIGRRDVLVTLGGGVLSDVVRMAASMVRRGIAHVCIPTTLVGQIDAALGVKAAVNFNGNKSFIGAFHAPEAVWIDSSLLATLPAHGLRDGFAEALKIAIVRDADLFATIERYGPSLITSGFVDYRPIGEMIVRRSAALTVDELSIDLFERGSLQRLLDFGHSFSPIIESAAQFTLSHGQAVAIDMLLSSAISCVLGLIDHNTYKRIRAVVAALGLPCDSDVLDEALMEQAVTAAAKHRAGCVNLVVPRRIGEGTFLGNEQLPRHILTTALALIREMPAVTQDRHLCIATA